MGEDGFWRSCPRALYILGRIRNEALGGGKAKAQQKPKRLSYIPR